MEHAHASSSGLLYEAPQKRISESSRRTIRAFGYAMLTVATLVLLWDTIALMQQTVGARLSGINDLWLLIDRVSYGYFQTAASQQANGLVWSLVLSPLVSTPICLMFGLPGFILTRVYSPEIEVRAPSELDKQIEAMGLARRKRH